MGPLIILGSGSLAREAAEWAFDSGYTVRGFFQNFIDGRSSVQGIPILNRLESFIRIPFLAAVGNSDERNRLSDIAMNQGLKPCAPIIHPSAVVARSAKIGAGSIICPHSVISCDVEIAENCYVNLAATIGHDCILARGVTVSPGVNISGNVRIGDGSYIGTNAVIREKISIGSHAMIGMGSVVVKDVGDSQTVVGNPARPMRRDEGRR